MLCIDRGESVLVLSGDVHLIARQDVANGAELLDFLLEHLLQSLVLQLRALHLLTQICKTHTTLGRARYGEQGCKHILHNVYLMLMSAVVTHSSQLAPSSKAKAHFSPPPISITLLLQCTSLHLVASQSPCARTSHAIDLVLSSPNLQTFEKLHFLSRD